jgi:hypothetical protein
MMRCTTFQDRPSQADVLHLDIWRNGVNVACDPGTFLYYAEPPWDNALASTLVHNTVSVDEEDQMMRGPRFLWLTWLKSQVSHHLTSEHGLLAYIEGVHYGYNRLPQPVTHRRAALKANEDVWIIVDDLTGQGEHHFRLHWLLADLPFVVDADLRRVSLTTDKDEYGLSLQACLPEGQIPFQFDVVREATDSAPRGWQSAHYGVREPALSVALSLKVATPCRLVSVFAPEKPDNRLLITANQIRFESNKHRLVANLLTPDSTSIIQDVLFDKPAVHEHLVIR